MNAVSNKATNNTRTGSFAAGKTFQTANKQRGTYKTLATAPPTFNKGRFSGGTEVHHNGKGPTIPKGSTSPAR